MKKEMDDALPVIIKLLEEPTFVANAADAGYEFDAPAIFKAFTDAILAARKPVAWPAPVPKKKEWVN